VERGVEERGAREGAEGEEEKAGRGRKADGRAGREKGMEMGLMWG
jgi:hypothetical protein